MINNKLKCWNFNKEMYTYIDYEEDIIIIYIDNICHKGSYTVEEVVYDYEFTHLAYFINQLREISAFWIDHDGIDYYEAKGCIKYILADDLQKHLFPVTKSPSWLDYDTTLDFFF